MRIALVLGALAACYSPKAKPGAQCSPMGQCPDGLVCAITNTCELPGTVPAIDAPADVLVPDGCSASAELCGDGIDQDCDGVDPACPPNDLPSGAIDVSAGGDFTADLTYAHDDAAPTGTIGCGSAGGRDIFYTVTVATDQYWYFDTFGSDFDTVIRVYAGSCVSGAVASNVCRDNQCGTKQTQWVGRLTAGDNCIVIDQHDGSVTKGSVKLHVEDGYWLGTQLPAGANMTSTGTTAAHADDQSGTCGGAGVPDSAYYMTGCPGVDNTLTATTCASGTAYNTVLTVIGPGKTQIACNDNDVACLAVLSGASTVSGVTLPGGHLYWLVVDGVLPTDTGAFTLVTTYQ